MALDKNPRQFWLEMSDVTANVIADSTKDFVTIEVAGKLLPSTQERIKNALLGGEFEIKVKTLA